MIPITVRYAGSLVTYELPENRFLWGVYESFSCVWAQAATSGTLTVPRHFATNFASVPRLLQAIISPIDGHIQKAAVVHDFLYGTHDYSRKFADALLFAAMIPLHAPWWKRWLVWLAVRLGGRRAYRNGIANQMQNIAAFQQLQIGAPLGTITICDPNLGYLIYDPLRNQEPTDYVRQSHD